MLYDKTEVIKVASIFGFAIKGLKTFRGRDGVGSQGNIYYNGKKVGWYNDSADGGASDIEFEGTKEQRVEMQGLLKEATRKYYEKFPMQGVYADLKPNEELFMARLVELSIEEKEFESILTKGRLSKMLYYREKNAYEEMRVYFASDKQLDEYCSKKAMDEPRVYRGLDDFNIDESTLGYAQIPEEDQEQGLQITQ